ncbi:glycosyltransferase [Salinibacter pepae]|jgi:glycosyltransferase involved in cell wall biosynthesis|uniref:glycosyltransferase n=1 Tax=Salinibacter pepae TaxID=3040382 RepID=UPI0021E7979E|nr:glycosyltransferase [Salinibacter pepae]
MSLNVAFFEPPPQQAEGGLERAIEMLDDYFEPRDVQVRRRATASEVWSRPPDLVHFHGLWQPDHAWASWLCRRLDVPYVVSPHGMLEPWAWAQKKWKKHPYYAAVGRFHLQGADGVLATSKQEASNLQAFVSEDQLRSIPLAITDDVGPAYSEAREALEWPDDERVLLYLSRVHPKKGLHMLLEALVDLPSSAKEKKRLVIVGPGPDDYAEQLKSYAQQHRDRLPQVDWEGPVWGNEKWTYLQGADLMCLPTHSENFGLVVLEALQVGTPVLTTDTTPWDFLQEWAAGLIVAPDVEEIGEALRSFNERFMWTDSKRHQLARRARKRFSMSKVGSKYAEVYGDVSKFSR